MVKFRKLILVFLISYILLLNSCIVSKEKYNSLQEQNQELQIQITNLNLEIESTRTFYNHFIKATDNFYLGGVNNDNANYNYDLWGEYYDQGYYYDSIAYCKAAREVFAASSNNYQNSISYFKEANKSAKEEYVRLIDLHVAIAESAIKINWAMYEVCEYFESASDLYDRGLWDTGTAELEEGNKKIAKHDSLIIGHNALISDLEMLIEKSL